MTGSLLAGKNQTTLAHLALGSARQFKQCFLQVPGEGAKLDTEMLRKEKVGRR